LQLKLPAAWCVSVMLEMRRSHRRTSAEQPWKLVRRPVKQHTHFDVFVFSVRPQRLASKVSSQSFVRGSTACVPTWGGERRWWRSGWAISTGRRDLPRRLKMLTTVSSLTSSAPRMLRQCVSSSQTHN
jgi:hypothetical protein